MKLTMTPYMHYRGHFYIVLPSYKRRDTIIFRGSFNLPEEDQPGTWWKWPRP